MRTYSQKTSEILNRAIFRTLPLWTTLGEAEKFRNGSKWGLFATIEFCRTNFKFNPIQVHYISGVIINPLFHWSLNHYFHRLLFHYLLLFHGFENWKMKLIALGQYFWQKCWSNFALFCCFWSPDFQKHQNIFLQMTPKKFILFSNF